MKFKALAISGTIILSASAWCVKSALSNAPRFSRNVDATAGPGGADHFSPGDAIPVAAAQGSNRVAAHELPQPEPAMPPPPARQQAPPSPGVPARTPPAQDPAFNAAAPALAASAAAGGKPAAGDGGTDVLELAPGVPVPVALLPSQDKRPTAAAAARQQIADSFVRAVDVALSQPEIASSDAAVNAAYENAASIANEQYRAMYGNEAYNGEVIRATLDAKSGN